MHDRSRTNQVPLEENAFLKQRVEELKQSEAKLAVVEKALRRTQERHQNLFVRASDGIMIMTTEGKMVEVNESFARMHGYSTEEMLLINLQDLDTPATFQLAPERMRRILAAEVLIFEVEHYHKDGHVFPLEVLASRISYDGESYVQCFHRDITKRKQAEKELQDSEAKHRRLFETMTQGVVYQASDGQIISANPAAERILGLSLDQMQGKTSLDPDWKAIREDGSELPGSEHPAMVSLRTGRPVEHFIMGVINPQKNMYAWISVTATPFFHQGETKPFQV